MKIPITEEDIQYALSDSPWDLGNEVLYNLCKNYPNHIDDKVIIAKIWLIGRAYAAAIERRKLKSENKVEAGDFYEKNLVGAVKESTVDQLIAQLPAINSNVGENSDAAIFLHGKLMEVFERAGAAGKRSLASKYLHFHRPDLFFIFDSRATNAIKNVVPRSLKFANGSKTGFDLQYFLFYQKCLWLAQYISREFKQDLSPRQIDKVLLRIAKTRSLEKIEKSNNFSK